MKARLCGELSLRAVRSPSDNQELLRGPGAVDDDLSRQNLDGDERGRNRVPGLGPPGCRSKGQ